MRNDTNVLDVPAGQQGDQRRLGHGRAEDLLEDGLRNLLAALGLRTVAARDQLERLPEGTEFMGGGAGESGAEDDVLGVVHRERGSGPEACPPVPAGAGVSWCARWWSWPGAGRDPRTSAARSPRWGCRARPGPARGRARWGRRRRSVPPPPPAARQGRPESRVAIRHGHGVRCRRRGWSACRGCRSRPRPCRPAAAATAVCGRSPRPRGFRWRSRRRGAGSGSG